MAAPDNQRRANRIALVVRLALTGAALSTAPWQIAAALAPAPMAASMDLYLDVTVNGAGRGLSNFYYRNGVLWADAATLRQLGFVLPAHAQDPIRIDSLNNVKVVYEPAQQSLSIVAPLQQLNLPVYVMHVDDTTHPDPSAARGLVLNYDLYGNTQAGGEGSLGAYTDMRAFVTDGVLNATALFRPISSVAGDRAVRMDTTFDRPFVDSMLDLKIGDTLSSAVPWSRPLRMGGVRFGTRFDLQPYFSPSPLPAFMGSVTLPSTAELYINGLRRYSGQVPAGPYRFENLPVVSGAGQATLVLTDALGQVTTLAFPIYGTTALLKKGLSDWSIEAGFVRQNYGLRSFDYDNAPVMSGSWRRGLADALTLEAHGEVTQGLANAGLGGSWLMGTAGVLSVSMTRSAATGSDGSKVSAGYQWNNARFNIGVSAARATDDYRDVAGLYGAPSPRLSATAQAGASAGGLGTLGVNYVAVRYPDQSAQRYAGLYWSRAFGERVSASLSANQNLAAPHDLSAFLGVGVSLSRGTYINSGLSHDIGGLGGSVSAAHPASSDGGFGWLAQASHSGAAGGMAQLAGEYLGPYGRASAGIYRSAGGESAYAGYSGSLVLMGGHFFSGRSVDNGFAVVSTDGVANVPVRLENNFVGNTNDKGLLMVTNLAPYQDNRISIDPMGLPVDVRLDAVSHSAVPADRGGVLVNFDIARVRAARVFLVDHDGKPLPVGSMARLHGASGDPTPVGYDGETYLDALRTRNVLDVTLPDGGTCHTTFALPPRGEGVPRVGPLVCRGAQS